MRVFIDIETIPAAWTPEQIDAAAAEAVPSNYSKPDTIAKWIAENRDQVHAKTALDWRWARILCVGVAKGPSPAQTYYNEQANDEGLAAVFDVLVSILREASRDDDLVLVGHNLHGFDLPMLWRHACRLRHPLAHVLPAHRPHVAKRTADTMDLWKSSDFNSKWSKLDDIARFLGIEGKADGWDGSKVWPAYQAGEHDAIRAYCARDVELTREVYLRMGGMVADV